MPSSTSSSELRAWRPTLVAATVFVVLLLGWRAVATSGQWKLYRFVSVPGAAQTAPVRASWVQVAIAGDSRLVCGIVPSVIESKLGQSVGLLWESALEQNLLRMLRRIRKVAPRRLLVALHAVALIDRPWQDVVPDGWPEMRRGIDRRLNDWVSELRLRITPRFGFDGPINDWKPFRRNEAPLYESIFASGRPSEAHLGRILSELRAMRDEGWQVACVRLPVHEVVRSVEERYFARNVVPAACADLELPFLDYYTEEFVSADGSHLHASEMDRFSLRLAADLRARIGW